MNPPSSAFTIVGLIQCRYLKPLYPDGEAPDVIPAKAGIQSFQSFLDPGACPGSRIRSGTGSDPGFAGVTLWAT